MSMSVSSLVKRKLQQGQEEDEDECERGVGGRVERGANNTNNNNANDSSFALTDSPSDSSVDRSTSSIR